MLVSSAEILDRVKDLLLLCHSHGKNDAEDDQMHALNRWKIEEHETSQRRLPRGPFVIAGKHFNYWHLDLDGWKRMNPSRR